MLLQPLHPHRPTRTRLPGPRAAPALRKVTTRSLSPPLVTELTFRTVATVTGEEDEDVSGELKGAKVFIKRGEHDFCEGILGNVKLLKHKGTGAERICTSSSRYNEPCY